MRARLSAPSVFICLVLGYSTLSWAEEAKKPGQIVAVEANLGRPVDFEKDVQPILDEKCVACHNVAIAESKLILEDVPSILKGGKRGTAVVAKDVEKSLIYQVAARAAEPAMPPLPNKVSASSLTPQELGILKKWMNAYAPPSCCNWGFYTNPEVEALGAAALAEFDEAKRNEILTKMNDTIMADAPELFIVHDLNPRALSPKLSGFVQAQSWFQDLTPIVVNP